MSRETIEGKAGRLLVAGHKVTVRADRVWLSCEHHGDGDHSPAEARALAAALTAAARHAGRFSWRIEARIARVVEFRSQGWTLRRIGAELGVSYEQVRLDLAAAADRAERTAP